MKKLLRFGIAVNFLMFFTCVGFGQPWTYDFGTGTGSYAVASGSSTTFLSSIPTNGGTYRVRCASSGNFGSGFILANPGTSLGSGTELQINASLTTSTNKFGVYDWNTPATVAYMKCKFRTTSSGSGNLNISLGINTLVSDNNGYTGQYNNSIASFTITYASGAISSVVRRISGGNQTISGSGFAKDSDQLIEIYANNGSGSVNYTRSGTNSLASQTWDLWVDGTKVVTNAAKAGSLAVTTNLSGFGFFAESSASNAAWIYIDDLEYSKTLPTGSTAPTVTTQAVSSIGTTNATGNGTITATGGVDPTKRGFCWDLATGADPDTNDTKVQETGTFTTGTFTGNISGLSAGTQYKVRAFATNTVGAGYGGVVTFTTLSNEPTNHPSGFTATANSQTSITTTWDDNDGAQAASGFLIMANLTGSFTDPADGTAQSDDTDLSDGTARVNVAHAVETYTWNNGLSAGTQYYFKIFAYNGSGGSINYKTDGTVPTDDATTNPANDLTSEVDGPVLLSQPNPVLISSLADTDGEAVRVFDMDVWDYGTDGLQTKITQLTIRSGVSDDADWIQTIQGVKLSTDGGSSYATIGTPTINAESIVIPVTSGNLNVPDEDAITVSLYIYLKTTVTDNLTLVFSVTQTGHGFVADATGSGFADSFTNSTTSNTMLTDVEATKLNFLQEPTSTLVNLDMVPAVTVEALDANNNRDLDATDDVTITSTGTLADAQVTAMINGLATFSNIMHTVTGTNLQLTASATGLTSDVSSFFDIFMELTAGDIIFVGYGTDDTDKFGFHLLTAVEEGTQIKFTDNAWTGSALATNEGTLTWTAPAGGASQGVVVTITGDNTASVGTIAETGSYALSTSGDQILAYQGSSSSPNFICGVSSYNWISEGTTTTNTSYLPAVLTVGTSAVSFGSEMDNGYYTGPETVTISVARSLCSHDANWLRDNSIQIFPDWTFTIGMQTIIDVTATAEDISINSDESMSIEPAKGLTVNGTFTNNAGTSGLIIKSDASGTGSLIENSGVAATVEQYITSEQWHLVSSPLSNATINTYFDIYLKEYDEPTETWTFLETPTTLPMTVGKGYSAWADNDYTGTTTVSFAGTLNNTDVAISGLDYTPASSPNDGFNLIGNPFPCAIEWNADWSTTNLSGWSVVYDAGTARGWHPTLGGYQGKTNGIIPAGQGFWVRATASGAGLTIPAAERVHSSQSFYKNDDIADFPVIKLLVNGNDYTDEAVVAFLADGTAGFDGYYDLETFANDPEVPKIFSLVQDRHLVYNVMPASYEETVIPVGFEVGLNGIYTIDVSSIQNFSDDINIYLEDLMTGAYVKLIENQSYTFDHTIINDLHRFNLRFTKSTFGVNELSETGITVFCKMNTVYIQVPANLQGSISVYDIIGQQLIDKSINTGLNQIPLYDRHGWLIVNVVTDKGSISQKVYLD